MRRDRMNVEDVSFQEKGTVMFGLRNLASMGRGGLVCSWREEESRGAVWGCPGARHSTSYFEMLAVKLSASVPAPRGARTRNRTRM